jgi:hypothetical protein
MFTKEPTLNRKRQRFILVSFIGFVYFVTGVLTWNYPPDYLAFGKFWALVFIATGFLAWMSLVYPAVWLATVTGAMLVGSALFRAGAIFGSVKPRCYWRCVFTTDAEPISSSFIIAGLTWTLVAVLIWIGWPQIQAGIIRSSNGE